MNPTEFSNLGIKFITVDGVANHKCFLYDTWTACIIKPTIICHQTDVESEEVHDEESGVHESARLSFSISVNI